MTGRAGRGRGLLALAAALAAAPAAALPRPELELELDPYYTAAAATFSLASATAAARADDTEIATYGEMARRALLPQFLLAEASVNPLPLAGASLRAASPGLYRSARVTPSLNLVEAVTTGFEEPYALSLFLGNVLDFSRGARTRGHRRKGYVGYLASAGNFHLMEGLFIPDNWLEVEAKFKGDLVTEARKMSWSFRAGAKAHSSPEVADSVYLGLRRDRIDYAPGPWSWLLSTGINYRADFRPRDLRPLSHFVLAEKNLPFSLRGRKVAFSLGLGYRWLSREKYSGSVAARRERPEAQVLLRPNVKF